METGLSQKQTQSLSPQMIQSMKLLQMDSQELLEYISEAIQENPVLELMESHEKRDELFDLCRKLEWLVSTDLQNREYYLQDSEVESDPLRNFGGVRELEADLYDFLLAQLQSLKLESQAVACVKFLIGCLDQNGWLDEDLPALSRESGYPLEQLERALTVVQTLEPAGVGARDLAECLRLQLFRRTPVDELAVRIVASHLGSLAKDRYGLIAQELNSSQKEVRRACEVIRSLDPRPGSRFAAYEAPAYVHPDMIVVKTEGGFELLANDAFFPALRISPYYTALLKESGQDEVREYLTEKVRWAKWTVQAIEQRRATLAACTQCILEMQEDFFRYGPGHLKPLSLADVAERVGVHESTVSRAIKGKYLQCPTGIYPLNSFFSRRLGTAGEDSGASSPDAAKAMLKKMVAEEDKRKPLSDQKLCECMATQGCVLSRRTVAKYRDELNIPSTAGRKHQR